MSAHGRVQVREANCRVGNNSRRRSRKRQSKAAVENGDRCATRQLAGRVEREDLIVQGPSPVYTLKRVQPRKGDHVAACPWKLLTGHWRLTDETGNESEVVRQESEGGSLIGTWKGPSGNATELVGWRPDRGELVATGYGDGGEFWEVKFTTVTEAMVKGPMVDRSSDGSLRRGTFQITRKSEDEFPTLFEGTIDGKKVTIKGCFTRVK